MSLLGAAGAEARVRIAAYRFGEHLRSHEVGPGALMLVSPSAAWATVKRLILRRLYGADVDITKVDDVGLHVYLLPTGEEVDSTGT
jgi:hypothetical protein